MINLFNKIDDFIKTNNYLVEPMILYIFFSKTDDFIRNDKFT